MNSITDLDGVATYLIESVRAFDEKRITAQELMARRAACSSVIRIGELKVRVAAMLQQIPKDTKKLLAFGGEADGLKRE